MRLVFGSGAGGSQLGGLRHRYSSVAERATTVCRRAAALTILKWPPRAGSAFDSAFRLSNQFAQAVWIIIDHPKSYIALASNPASKFSNLVTVIKMNIHSSLAANFALVRFRSTGQVLEPF
jgi:hypothetical protein